MALLFVPPLVIFVSASLTSAVTAYCFGYHQLAALVAMGRVQSLLPPGGHGPLPHAQRVLQLARQAHRSGDDDTVALSWHDGDQQVLAAQGREPTADAVLSLALRRTRLQQAEVRAFEARCEAAHSVGRVLWIVSCHRTLALARLTFTSLREVAPQALAHLGKRWADAAGAGAVAGTVLGAAVWIAIGGEVLPTVASGSAVLGFAALTISAARSARDIVVTSASGSTDIPRRHLALLAATLVLLGAFFVFHRELPLWSASVARWVGTHVSAHFDVPPATLTAVVVGGGLTLYLATRALTMSRRALQRRVPVQLRLDAAALAIFGSALALAIGVVTVQRATRGDLAAPLMPSVVVTMFTVAGVISLASAALQELDRRRRRRDAIALGVTPRVRLRPWMVAAGYLSVVAATFVVAVLVVLVRTLVSQGRDQQAFTQRAAEIAAALVVLEVLVGLLHVAAQRRRWVQDVGRMDRSREEADARRHVPRPAVTQDTKDASTPSYTTDWLTTSGGQPTLARTTHSRPASGTEGPEMALAHETSARRHADDAARFTELVRSASIDDWTRPSPVAGWTALDVVKHLVEWSRGFVQGAGIDLPPLDVDADPVAAWERHVADVQAILDDPAGRTHSNPHTGDMPVDEAIDRFYTGDIWMHSWDLAKALGREPDLGQERCHAALTAMRPIEQLLRDSGHYGPAVPVKDDASPQDKLMAFVGRDPAWEPDDARR